VGVEARDVLRVVEPAVERLELLAACEPRGQPAQAPLEVALRLLRAGQKATPDLVEVGCELVIARQPAAL
jgi:hypothetical protein